MLRRWNLDPLFYYTQLSLEEMRWTGSVISSKRARQRFGLFTTTLKCFASTKPSLSTLEMWRRKKSASWCRMNTIPFLKTETFWSLDSKIRSNSSFRELGLITLIHPRTRTGLSVYLLTSSLMGQSMSFCEVTKMFQLEFSTRRNCSTFVEYLESIDQCWLRNYRCRPL